MVFKSAVFTAVFFLSVSGHAAKAAKAPKGSFKLGQAPEFSSDYAPAAFKESVGKMQEYAKRKVAMITDLLVGSALGLLLALTS